MHIDINVSKCYSGADAFFVWKWLRLDVFGGRIKSVNVERHTASHGIAGVLRTSIERNMRIVMPHPCSTQPNISAFESAAYPNGIAALSFVVTS